MIQAELCCQRCGSPLQPARVALSSWGGVGSRYGRTSAGKAMALGVEGCEGPDLTRDPLPGHGTSSAAACGPRLRASLAQCCWRGRAGTPPAELGSWGGEGGEELCPWPFLGSSPESLVRPTTPGL